MTRIRELREERKISQKELSIQMEVSQAAVVGWESGSKMPTVDNLIKIADYFNVSVDYLVGRTNNPIFLRNIGDNSIIGEIETNTEVEEQSAPTIKRMPKNPEELEAFINQIINKK